MPPKVNHEINCVFNKYTQLGEFMAKERIFKFIDNTAPEEEQVKEVTAMSYKKAVKSYQGGSKAKQVEVEWTTNCLLYTSPSPRDLSTSRMPSSA